MHLYVYHSTIYNSQDMEATEVSINRWMDKEDVVHIYNGILFSHKKKRNPFATTWMDLEGTMLSEISQAEKDKYQMISLICGVSQRKNLRNKTAADSQNPRMD